MCIKRVGKLRDQSFNCKKLLFQSHLRRWQSQSVTPVCAHGHCPTAHPHPPHPPCTVHTAPSPTRQCEWHPWRKCILRCIRALLSSWQLLGQRLRHTWQQSPLEHVSQIFSWPATYNIRNAFMRERITKLISSRTWNDWPCPDAHCPNPHGPPSNLRPMRKQFYLMIFS